MQVRNLEKGHETLFFKLSQAGLTQYLDVWRKVPVRTEVSPTAQPYEDFLQIREHHLQPRDELHPCETFHLCNASFHSLVIGIEREKEFLYRTRG